MWKPSLFDREKTAFSLQGSHRDVPCSACDTLRKKVGANLALPCKPTPAACEACHGTNVPKEREERSAVEKIHPPQVIFTRQHSVLRSFFDGPAEQAVVS
jgi:hypothetical protein